LFVEGELHSEFAVLVHWKESGTSGRTTKKSKEKVANVHESKVLDHNLEVLPTVPSCLVADEHSCCSGQH
jgi:hypothetical protein